MTPRSVQLVQSVDDAAHVAAQPIETPHDEGVAIAQIVHAFREAWSIITGTRHHVMEDLARTGSRQGFRLLLQRLADR